MTPPPPQEATYEMFWDCKYCGQKKLLGLTHRFCAKCGGPQDPASRYFPPDNEKIAVEAHPLVGADVVCPACRNPCARSATCCGQCGGPLEKGAAVALRPDEVRPDGGNYATAPAMGMGAPVRPVAPQSGKGLLLAGATVLVLAVIGGIAAMLLLKRSGNFEVTGHSWERTIAIQRLELATDSAWCDQLPSGARETSRHRETRSTTKVPDGEDCKTRRKDNGNGTFKEVRECTPKFKDQPVMGDRCDFVALKWKTARTLREQGTSTSDAPRWPNVELVKAGSTVGCEREAERAEKYVVRFIDSKTKSERTCETSRERWASFPDGARYTGKIGVLTGSIDCDSMTKL